MGDFGTSESIWPRVLTCVRISSSAKARAHRTSRHRPGLHTLCQADFRTNPAPRSGLRQIPDSSCFYRLRVTPQANPHSTMPDVVGHLLGRSACWRLPAILSPSSRLDSARCAALEWGWRAPRSRAEAASCPAQAAMAKPSGGSAKPGAAASKKKTAGGSVWRRSPSQIGGSGTRSGSDFVRKVRVLQFAPMLCSSWRCLASARQQGSSSWSSVARAMGSRLDSRLGSRLWKHLRLRG